MRASASTTEKVQAARERVVGARARAFDAELEVCDSPIEQLFLATMMCTGWHSPGFHEARLVHDARAAIVVGTPRGCLVAEDGPAVAFVQASPTCVRGSSFRCDFVFTTTTIPLRRLVVELDGHDFHERTKAQARRDKSRDRLLVRSGWTVIRFTGGEVHADAGSCLEQVVRILDEDLALATYGAES